MGRRPASMPVSTPVSVNISVSIDSQGNANFSYNAGAQRVYVGDTVQWTCSDGPIAILFKEGTPCDQMDARSANGTGPFFTIPLNVRTDAQPGHYHYAVAAYVSGQVYLDAACPELIVN
jgi:plastocyanin